MTKTFDVVCPCCNMPLKIEMILSDDGEIHVGLFHYISEPSYEEIQSKGIEFGSREGGEQDIGEDESFSFE